MAANQPAELERELHASWRAIRWGHGGQPASRAGAGIARQLACNSLGPWRPTSQPSWSGNCTPVGVQFAGAMAANQPAELERELHASWRALRWGHGGQPASRAGAGIARQLACTSLGPW